MPRFSSLRKGSGYGAQKPHWHIKNVLYNLDIFGKELPAFNLKGNPGIKTVAGGLMTILISFIAILYASMRMVVLVNGDNPQINIFTSRNLIPNEEYLNLNDINYRMAFVVEGFAD